MSESTDSTKTVQRKIGNTIQSSAKDTWFFTFNNYDTESIEYLQIVFNGLKAKYIFGEEVGDSGTPHLQGNIKLPKRKRLSALVKIDPRIHWEPTRNNDKAITYCQKDSKVYTNMRLEKYGNPYKDVVWRPWQKRVLDIIKSEPDDRSIYWFWEPTGNVGKSYITRYLMKKENALICGGKAGDIFHQVAKRLEDGFDIKIAIMDIPRTYMGFISYQAIESLKNGFIISGKYEGGQYDFGQCHVICFANEEPNKEAVSVDRWRIIRINDEVLSSKKEE